MQLEAVELAAAVRFDDAGGEALGLCLFDESWHQGVVGLVAGRIKDRLHRPVIAFARAEDGSLRGSARSVPGIHIRDVLDGIATRHPGLIDKFGGHAMAAGMTLREASLDEFRARLCRGIAARADSRIARGHHSHRRRIARAPSSASRPRGCCAARGPGARDFPSRYSTATSSSRMRDRRRQAPEAAASRQPRRRGARRPLDAIAFGYVGGVRRKMPSLRSGRDGASSRIDWKSTNTTAPSACSSIASTCELVADPGCAKIRGYGNQSTETIHQRSRGAHRLLEEVSLITTTSTSGCRK